MIPLPRPSVPIDGCSWCGSSDGDCCPDSAKDRNVSKRPPTSTVSDIWQQRRIYGAGPRIAPMEPI